MWKDLPPFILCKRLNTHYSKCELLLQIGSEKLYPVTYKIIMNPE